MGRSAPIQDRKLFSLLGLSFYLSLCLLFLFPSKFGRDDVTLGYGTVDAVMLVVTTSTPPPISGLFLSQICFFLSFFFFSSFFLSFLLFYLYEGCRVAGS